jgi:hypothetical protein
MENHELERARKHKKNQDDDDEFDPDSVDIPDFATMPHAMTERYKDYVSTHNPSAFV